VFYPVASLPGFIRPVALALPSSHVFEGMRAVLADGVVRWDHLAWAVGLNVVWMIAALLVFSAQFRHARQGGALLNIGE
jgi:ABC-2 type transport system permease protein